MDCMLSATAMDEPIPPATGRERGKQCFAFTPYASQIGHPVPRGVKSPSLADHDANSASSLNTPKLFVYSTGRMWKKSVALLPRTFSSIQ